MELENNKTLTRKEKEFLYHKMDIIHFATQVFGKYGYNAATTAEISNSAGYAKGSLYVYFKNKRELFLEVVNQILNDIEKIIDESFVLNNTRQSLERYFKILSDYFNENRSAYELLMREVYELRKGDLKKESPKLFDKIVQLKRKIADKLSYSVKISNLNKDELEYIVMLMHNNFFFSQMKINSNPNRSGRILKILTKITFEGILK